MLPDGDGFSLMKKLRTFTDIPIIFLTAKDEAADKLAGLGLGADDYVVKPFCHRSCYCVSMQFYADVIKQIPHY